MEFRLQAVCRGSPCPPGHDDAKLLECVRCCGALAYAPAGQPRQGMPVVLDRRESAAAAAHTLRALEAKRADKCRSKADRRPGNTFSQFSSCNNSSVCYDLKDAMDSRASSRSARLPQEGCRRRRDTPAPNWSASGPGRRSGQKKGPRAPVRTSVPHGEKAERKPPSELSSEGCQVALVVRVVLDRTGTEAGLGRQPSRVFRTDHPLDRNEPSCWRRFGEARTQQAGTFSSLGEAGV